LLARHKPAAAAPLTASAVGHVSFDYANHVAQQNVNVYVPTPRSPFEPIRFAFQVNNGSPHVEEVRLQPDQLPCGMRLMVRMRIRPHARVSFMCTLQLDESIITTGCAHDRAFLLHALRRSGHHEEF
jgi:hypothetical protein